MKEDMELLKGRDGLDAGGHREAIKTPCFAAYRTRSVYDEFEAARGEVPVTW